MFLFKMCNQCVYKQIEKTNIFLFADIEANLSHCAVIEQDVKNQWLVKFLQFWMCVGNIVELS